MSLPNTYVNKYGYNKEEYIVRGTTVYQIGDSTIRRFWEYVIKAYGKEVASGRAKEIERKAMNKIKKASSVFSYTKRVDFYDGQEVKEVITEVV